MTAGALILAPAWDAGAAAVASGLAGRLGRRSVALVTPDHLASARWVHRVGVDGSADSDVRLPSGAPLVPDGVAVVLNRIDGVPLWRFARSDPRDRDYAGMEFQALVASWLEGLRVPVLNPVCGGGTVRLPPRRWCALAAAAGLPVRPTAVTVGRRVAVGPERRAAGAEHVAGSVLVTGDRAHGALAAALGAACVALAALAGRPLIRCTFATDGAGPVLADVEDPPALHDDHAVAAVVDHVHRLVDARAVA